MVTQTALSPEPFRWKLFLFVMFVMGSITTVAIILTLMALPEKGGVHVPALKPIAQMILPSSGHPNPA